MAVPNATTCAACGASGELHEHHLVPKVRGGGSLPTVLLCTGCHGKAHERAFPANHRELTIAGLNAARDRGKKFGNPYRDGAPVIRAMQEAAKLAAEAAKAARIAAEKAEIWATGIAELAVQTEAKAIAAAGRLGIDLPYRQALARRATEVKQSRAREQAIRINAHIEEAKAAGHKSLNQLAAALMAKGVLTPGGKEKWTAQQVRPRHVDGCWEAANDPGQPHLSAALNQNLAHQLSRRPGVALNVPPRTNILPLTTTTRGPRRPYTTKRTMRRKGPAHEPAPGRHQAYSFRVICPTGFVLRAAA